MKIKCVWEGEGELVTEFVETFYGFWVGIDAIKNFLMERVEVGDVGDVFLE